MGSRIEPQQLLQNAQSLAVMPTTVDRWPFEVFSFSFGNMDLEYKQFGSVKFKVCCMLHGTLCINLTVPFWCAFKTRPQVRGSMGKKSIWDGGKWPGDSETRTFRPAASEH